MSFIETIKARARSNVKTIVLPESEDDRTILRIVSEDPPSGSAASVPATLEDLYLYHFPTERS